MKIKVISLVSVVVSLAVLTKLGLWQVERYSEKLALEKTYKTNSQLSINQQDLHNSATSLNYKNIKLSGRWIAGNGFFLNLKKHNDKAGMQVIMPLLLASGTKVLVNRGWIKHNAADKNDPKINTTNDVITIKGVARKMSNPYFMTNSAISKRKMFIDMEELSASDSSLAKIVVFQTNDTNDSLIRQWSIPNFKPMMHLGYAIMWFSFALILLISVLYIQFKEDKDEQI